jgi:hypothetical protein
VSYLSVTNFWKYQDKNAWKKAKTHPPWFKQYVHRDIELDALPLEARLLFYEILAVATRYSNVLEADLNWLWAETRIEPELIGAMLPLLLKGGWLSQTKSKRRGASPVPDPVPDPVVQDVDVEEELKDLALEGPTSNGQQLEHRPYDKPTDSLTQLRRLIGRTIHDQVDLDAELRSGDHHLTETQISELRAMLA